MSVNGLKAITPVPNVNDFLDIILSSVQRKTPTVIHKNVSAIGGRCVNWGKTGKDVDDENC